MTFLSDMCAAAAADAALLKFARAYISSTYQAIIAALAASDTGMTPQELRDQAAPSLSINGIKHAVHLLRRRKVVYVKEYLPHPGKPQMLLALGCLQDAPQVRRAPKGVGYTPRRVKIAAAPKESMPPPKLPTHTPRLGMFGV